MVAGWKGLNISKRDVFWSAYQISLQKIAKGEVQSCSWNGAQVTDMRKDYMDAVEYIG